MLPSEVTPAAEFNIHCDPEAAKICFTAGLPVYMVGLDVTRRVLVLPGIIERMEKVGGRAAEMFTALMKTFNENQKKVFGLPGGPLHDPVTVAVDPQFVPFVDIQGFPKIHGDHDPPHAVDGPDAVIVFHGFDSLRLSATILPTFPLFVKF